MRSKLDQQNAAKKTGGLKIIWRKTLAVGGWIEQQFHVTTACADACKRRRQKSHLSFNLAVVDCQNLGQFGKADTTSGGIQLVRYLSGSNKIGEHQLKWPTLQARLVKHGGKEVWKVWSAQKAWANMEKCTIQRNTHIWIINICSHMLVLDKTCVE